MTEASELRYKRVLLKLSGEALAGERGFGIEPAVVDRLTDEIRSLVEMGVSLGIVIGGGNIVRGAIASQEGMDRVQADYMGMLSTVINALAVQDLLETKSVETRVMTAIRMEEIIEQRKIRDWTSNSDVQKEIMFAMEEYLYSVKGRYDIPLTPGDMDVILDAVIDIAIRRDQL